MEPEIPQLVWKDVSSAALITCSGKTAEQTIDLVGRLVTEASTRDSRLLSVKTIPVSLAIPRLESWAYGLAVALIQQWRTLEEAEPSIPNILAELGLSSTEGTAPLIDAMGNAGTQVFPIIELKERLQNLYEHQSREKLSSIRLRVWLEREAARLADWFTQVPTADALMSQPPEAIDGCLVKLQLHAPTLHTQTLQILENCFTQLQQFGSQAILKHLNLLSQALKSTLTNYEIQQQEHLRRESGAWRAYHNLMTQIEARQWGSAGKGNLAWEAALRALSLIYISKLKAETYALAGQLVSDLIQQTHRYAAVVADTDTLLNQLQTWFVQRSPAESNLSPLLKSFLAERIDPGELRHQLEEWMGYSLPQWGSIQSMQRGAICEQILTWLRPICLAVYSECCAALVLGISTSDLK